jgi:hypothetical protein
MSLPYSALPGRLGKEGFDNLFQFGALAFRTLNFLCIVLHDGQNFGNFFTARAADVFVEWHRFWLAVGFP